MSGMNYECGKYKDSINDVEDAKYVKLECDENEMVKKFCSLGDMLGKCDSTGKAVMSRTGVGSRKFKELPGTLFGRVICKLKNRLY